MFSTSKSSFLVTAIVSSIVKMAVGGPLDCISGPCVTVEGVGKPMLGICRYPTFIPSECNPKTFPSQCNPIPMQLFRKAARKLGAHPVVPSSDQPVHGDSFWWDDCWGTQVIIIIFTVVFLQHIAENTKVSIFQICTTSAKSASQWWKTQCIWCLLPLLHHKLVSIIFIRMLGTILAIFILHLKGGTGSVHNLASPSMESWVRCWQCKM